MWKLLKKIIKTGILTEKPSHRDEKEFQRTAFSKSLAVRHVDAGSCNGCELELWALENPYYSASSQGIKFVASPRHADALLVTGPITHAMHEALLKTQEAVPNPRRVIAIGDCACDGGVFAGSYAVLGGLEVVLTPDAKVPGCPPTPQDILNILRKAFART